MDRYEAGGYAMIVVGVTITVIAVVGELRGWWRDFVAAVVGLVLTGLGMAVTLLLGATKKQVGGVSRDVRHVREEVREVGDGVRQVGQDVRHVGEDVRSGNAKLDTVIVLLTQIRDRLPPP